MSRFPAATRRSTPPQTQTEEWLMLRSIQRRERIVARAAMVLTVLGVAAAAPAAASAQTPPRQTGPCDIYAAAGTPCVAAHSSTRALYASYNGPLYQVKRQSDSAAKDIGVGASGYADAAAQDAFCASTVCWITTLYDQ